VTAETIVKHTERSMLNLLRARHAQSGGNGPAWAYMEHVRNAAGFKATRTLDAMALDLWPSRGHELHGFEVKVSRADFRRELADGGKADTWHGIVDRFWIVAPAGIVPKDELPAAWGLLECDAAGTKLRVSRPAPLQTTERSDITRNVLVPMLRAAGAALAVTPEQAALDEAYQRGVTDGMARAGSDAEALRDHLRQAQEDQDRHRGVIRQFEEAIGVELETWRRDGSRVAQVRKALLSVLAEDDAVERAKQKVQLAAESLDMTARHLAEQAQWIRNNAGRHS
jgi:hypothetical protein